MDTVQQEANITPEAPLADAGGPLDPTHAQSTADAASQDAAGPATEEQPAAGQPPDVGGLRHRVGELEAAVGRYQAEIDGLREKLNATVPKYRQALLQASPDLPAELVVGNSVEELDRAVAIAKEVVAKVRHQLAAETADHRVPPGAPGRLQPDLSMLSPREKIMAGLAQG
jgi:hypothetical protein